LIKFRATQSNRDGIVAVVSRESNKDGERGRHEYGMRSDFRSAATTTTERFGTAAVADPIATTATRAYGILASQFAAIGATDERATVSVFGKNRPAGATASSSH